MLHVQGISRWYGSFCALSDLHFQAGKGEIIALVGANGAGKSTALRIIAGVGIADQGEVFINEIEIHKSPLQARSLIGFVPERLPLYDDMSVHDFLAFCADVQNQPSDHVVAEIYTLLQLEEVRKKSIRTLSRGYRQRVALAQALIHDPQLLVLDEPTSGLDPFQSQEFYELLKNISAAGKTILFSTHLLSEVELLAHKVVMLNAGQRVAYGPFHQIFSRAGINQRFILHIQSNQSEAKLIKAFADFPFVEKIESFHEDTAPSQTSHEKVHVLKIFLKSDLPKDASAQIWLRSQELNLKVEKCVEENPSLREAFLALLQEQRSKAL